MTTYFFYLTKQGESDPFDNPTCQSSYNLIFPNNKSCEVEGMCGWEDEGEGDDNHIANLKFGLIDELFFYTDLVD